MSDPDETKKDESRKRKFLNTRSQIQTNQDESSTGNNENTQPLPAPVTVVTDNSSVERPHSTSVNLSDSIEKQRAEYVKILNSVISQSNYKHDMKTQRELFILQAQNDESDDEPLPRRARRNDFSQDAIPLGSALHSRPGTSTENNVTPATSGIRDTISNIPVNIVDPEDVNSPRESQSHQRNTNFTENGDLATRIQRFEEEYLRPRRCTSPHNMDSYLDEYLQPRNSTTPHTGSLPVEDYLTPRNFTAPHTSRLPLADFLTPPECCPPTHTGTLQPMEEYLTPRNRTDSHTVTSSMDTDYIPLPSTSTRMQGLFDVNIPSLPYTVTPVDRRVPEVNIPNDHMSRRRNNRAPRYRIHMPNQISDVHLNFDYMTDEDSDTSDEMISNIGDESLTQQRNERISIQERLLESDDEQVLQMVEEVQNCYINVENRRLVHHGSGSDTRNQLIRAPGGLPRRVTWRYPRGRFGGRGRGPSRSINLQFSPFGLPYDNIGVNGLYFLHTNEMFYPVQVIEESNSRNNDYERLMYGLSVNETSRRGNDITRDYLRRHVRVPSLLEDFENAQLPTISSRRSSRITRSRRMRSASSENLPTGSRLSWNNELDNLDSDGETTLAVAPCQAGTNSSPANSAGLSSYFRSTPELNVIGICPICAKGLNKKEVASTFCGHLFCMDCIKRAMIINGKRCPTCRRILEGQCYHPVYF